MGKSVLIKNALLPLVIASIGLFYISCKKDWQMENNKTENVTVQEAKPWMQSNRPDIDMGENWNNTKQINYLLTQVILRTKRELIIP